MGFLGVFEIIVKIVRTKYVSKETGGFGGGSIFHKYGGDRLLAGNGIVFVKLQSAGHDLVAVGKYKLRHRKPERQYGE